VSGEDDRVLLTTGSVPGEWSWGMLDASRPRRALEHLTMSDVTTVAVDCLKPSDVPPGSEWSLRIEIPVIVIDTLDAYYVFERVLNKLNTYGRTPKPAKWELLTKLWGHRQLLQKLESPEMADRLRLELEFLRVALTPNEVPNEVPNELPDEIKES